jgi:TRAP-type C4-dicarboxylate transport system permease small subunit
VADPEPTASGTGEGAPHEGVPASVFRRIVTGLNALGSGWIFVLMLIIDGDAIGRSFFNHPLEGVIEITQMSIVAIVFLQLSDALRTGKLTRSDGLFNLMLARRRRVGRAMGVVFDGLGAAFLGLVLYGSVPLLAEAWERNYYIGEKGLFVFPTWPVKLLVVIGTLVMLVQFLVFAWRYAHPGNGGEAEPTFTPEGI